MRVFEEMADEARIKKYGPKALELDVSYNLLCGNAMNYGIPIHKLIAKASSKEDFNRKVLGTLYDSERTDFYDFSLLMGLYFGVYNSYGYLYVAPEVKREVIEANPNREDTISFLAQYQEAICHYFQEAYDFSDLQTTSFVEKMTDVLTGSELYHKSYVHDFGKLLMGVYLLYDKEEVNTEKDEISKMISSGAIISEFNRRNRIEIVQSTGFKK